MVTPSTTSIVDLRRVLSGRFPGAHARRGPLPANAPISTGVAALDAILGGGLPKGRFTELVGDGPGSGSAQVLHALLRRVSRDGQFLALVDGADSFDVDAERPETLARLLWVRC